MDTGMCVYVYISYMCKKMNEKIKHGEYTCTFIYIHTVNNLQIKLLLKVHSSVQHKSPSFITAAGPGSHSSSTSILKLPHCVTRGAKIRDTCNVHATSHDNHMTLQQKYSYS